MYFLCGLMCTWIHESVAELISMRFFFQMFEHIVLCFRLLYAIVRRQMFMMCARAHARVCVIHWHCSAQLSMINMEKRYRNTIIVIIIITLICQFLLVAQFVETATTNSVFLWNRSQRDVHGSPL